MQAGYWSERYIPYSFIDNNEIVSNVSANIMSIVMEGQKYNAVQIGTVMTKQSCRGKGLATELMKRVIDNYMPKCNFLYLFPNEDELNFYQKLGFTLSHYRKYKCTLPKRIYSDKTPRKLNIEDSVDRSIIERIVRSHKPQSDLFDFADNTHVRFWHYLYTVKEHIYYIEQLDALSVFFFKENTLNLIDVVSRNIIPLESVFSIINTNASDNAHILFTPSKHDINVLDISSGQGNPFFYMHGNVKLTEFASFPYTSQA